MVSLRKEKRSPRAITRNSRPSTWRCDSVALTATGLIGLFTILASASCEQATTTTVPVSPAPGVVAQIDGENIFGDDLRARFQEGPVEVRLRSMSKGGRHYLLNLVIDENLMLREALKRGQRLQFSDVHEQHGLVMRRFLAAEFEDSVSPADIPAEEIQRLYESSRDLLANPSQRKVRVIATETPEQAREVIATVSKALAGRDTAEIHNATHPAKAASGSQGGVFNREAAETYVGADAAQAAFAIDDTPGVYPDPVRYLEAWSAVVVLSVYPPQPPPPLEKAAPQLRQQLFDSLRNRRLNQFVDGFRKNHEVTISPEGMTAVPWSPPEPVPVEPTGIGHVPTPLIEDEVD